jgi:translation initiation factor 3 subunit A
LISSFRIDEKRLRDELKNNMRIVWDGYKSIIETVKINQRLEDLYHETLQMLFNFADKYNRKHEFKRYCDTIRTGLQTLFKNKLDRTEAQKAIYIDIDDANVNENNVQIRLEQFEVATKLGLWQESFQVLEDINMLMKTRKGTVKKRTRARYYLNLSKLFKKSNYWNYHAFTYFNYYNTNRSNPELKAEDVNRMTDELLLSVMCIPPFSIERNQNEESQNKICSLVTSTNHIPDKAELYRLVLEKGILESASDHIKRLWAFLFIEFKILDVPEKLSLLDCVKTSPHFEFTSLLEDVIIYKELIEISKIYSKVRLENILRMVPFDKQKVITILLRTKEHEVLQFEFDESNNLIIFKQKEHDTDPYIIVKNLARDVAYIAEKVRKPNRDEIVKQAQLFIDDAKELYFRIRPYKSQQFREKLKQPMRELRNSEMERERKELEQK